MLVTVYVTFPDKKTAVDIARSLVDERLVACANVFAIDSIFRWEGKVQEQPEFAAFFKTSEARAYEAMMRISKLHPYDTPCVERLDAKADEKYSAWICSEVNGRSV